MLLDAFFRACPDKFVPTFFDEAGHRVATQYLMSVLEGNFEAERLVDYRRGHSLLPGHPELGMATQLPPSTFLWPFFRVVPRVFYAMPPSPWWFVFTACWLALTIRCHLQCTHCTAVQA